MCTHIYRERCVIRNNSTNNHTNHDIISSQTPVRRPLGSRLGALWGRLALVPVPVAN